jgi:hypothetical protein
VFNTTAPSADANPGDQVRGFEQRFVESGKLIVACRLELSPAAGIRCTGAVPP